MILERPWPNHSTKDSIKKSCVCSARCAVPCKAAKKLTSFGKSGVPETVLGTGWVALFIFAGELWGNSCLRARWWSGTQKVDEVEAEQQPAFCQGQATHMGACCCQVNKSPTQHSPSCASCLKCYCTSFPVAVMGPVFIQRMMFPMQTSSLMLEVLFQHKQGGTQVFGWAGEVPEGRRMLVQTGNDSQLWRDGLSRLHPCCVQAQAGVWVQLCWQDHGSAVLLTLGLVRTPV